MGAEAQRHVFGVLLRIDRRFPAQIRALSVSRGWLIGYPAARCSLSPWWIIPMPRLTRFARDFTRIGYPQRHYTPPTIPQRLLPSSGGRHLLPQPFASPSANRLRRQRNGKQFSYSPAPPCQSGGHSRCSLPIALGDALATPLAWLCELHA